MVKAVLFDLDGTLVDNFVAIHACYSEAATRLGQVPHSYDTVRKAIGGSVPITLAKLLPAELVPAAVDHYREAFGRRWHEGLAALPGAEAVLAALSGCGIRCAVFTNKNGLRSRQICDHLGLSPYLAFVLGTGDIPGRKPEPAFSQAALDRLGLPVAEVCLVGDSPYDLDAARAISMTCYTVATGSHDAADLAAAGADGVYPDLPTLARCVFGLDLQPSAAVPA